jgi:anti-anti-sigma factor
MRKCLQDNVTPETRRAMSEDSNTDGPVHVRIPHKAVASTGIRGDPWDDPSKADGRPRLRVKTIERTAIIRFEDAEILFDESDVRSIGEQLGRLLDDEGQNRLLVNFGGVQYLSSDVLAILALLQKRMDPARGRIQLCGMDPLLRDMVRITRLDRVFDVCGDEAEALGLLIR